MFLRLKASWTLSIRTLYNKDNILKTQKFSDEEIKERKLLLEDMFKEGKIKLEVFERMMKDFDGVNQDNRIENDMKSKQLEF